MTKREMIDGIMEINHSAHPEFLADFNDLELEEYLQHLKCHDKPALTGNAHRYDKYFTDQPVRRLHWNTLQQCVDNKSLPATAAM